MHQLCELGANVVEAAQYLILLLAGRLLQTDCVRHDPALILLRGNGGAAERDDLDDNVVEPVDGDGVVAQRGAEARVGVILHGDSLDLPAGDDGLLRGGRGRGGAGAMQRGDIARSLHGQPATGRAVWGAGREREEDERGEGGGEGRRRVRDWRAGTAAGGAVH
ncbi:hypothetical protein FGB62_71g225 [Gracilaria domingensis]|nr:hypothetical protein FGB62_71g225 [Gracilaria domingensis]